MFLVNISALSKKKNKTIIYGAGSLGNSVSKILIEKGDSEIIGFIDHDYQKIVEYLSLDNQLSLTRE